MSTLTTLKFTSIKKPTQQPAVVQRRAKLSKKLFEQIELAKAQRDGRSYNPTRLRRFKSVETGISQMIEAPKRIKPWWWTGQDGQVYLTIFYGSRSISFGKGKAAIEVGSNADLLAALETVKKAVEVGELDHEIEAVSGALKANFKQ